MHNVLAVIILPCVRLAVIKRKYIVGLSNQQSCMFKDVLQLTVAKKWRHVDFTVTLCELKLYL